MGGLARVAIQNNTIREWTNAHGISIATAEGSADIDATVTGNSVKNPDPTLGLNGIRFDPERQRVPRSTMASSALQ